MAPSCRPAEQCLCADRAARPTAILQRQQGEIVLRPRVALRGGHGEPAGSLWGILLDALAREVHQGQRYLRPVVTLLGSLLVPAGRGAQVHRHAVTIGVEDAQTEFGKRIALLGGEQVPAPGLRVITFATHPSRVHQPGVGLRFGHALFRRRTAPAQGFSSVVRRLDAVWEEQLAVALGGGPIPRFDAWQTTITLPAEMEKAEFILRLRVTLLGRAQIAARRIGKVGDNAMSPRIEPAQPEERLGIAGCRKLGPFSERGAVFPALVGGAASLCCGLCVVRPAPPELHHGSRIASPIPRITPRQTYMKAERVPTWISAVKVMPGTRRKLSGTDLRLTSVKAMRAL